MADERGEIQEVYQRYQQDELTAGEAAQQLSTLLGGEVQAQDQKLDALRSEMEPMTGPWCIITVTAATSCSRWCD